MLAMGEEDLGGRYEEDVVVDGRALGRYGAPGESREKRVEGRHSFVGRVVVVEKCGAEVGSKIWGKGQDWTGNKIDMLFCCVSECMSMCL